MFSGQDSIQNLQKARVMIYSQHEYSENDWGSISNRNANFCLRRRLKAGTGRLTRHHANRMRVFLLKQSSKVYSQPFGLSDAKVLIVWSFSPAVSYRKRRRYYLPAGTLESYSDFGNVLLTCILIYPYSKNQQDALFAFNLFQ